MIIQNILMILYQKINKNTMKFLEKLKIFSIVLVLIIFYPVYAEAHWADMAAMEIDIDGKKADAEVTLPIKFIESIDDNKDNKISNEEIEKNAEKIKEIISKDIFVKSDGEIGELSIKPSKTNSLKILENSNKTNSNFKETHIVINLQWNWENEGKIYGLNYSLFPKEAINAHCLVNLTMNNKTKTIIFDQKKTNVMLNDLTTFESIKAFLFLGVEHIATGYDHILFLISLLLAGGGVYYLLRIITAFTIAHSVTLSLAVLDIVNISPRIIEPFIALSIIYVATENFWRKKDEVHWGIVFLFGLVHGLGFAGILKDLDLPKENLFESLVSFNIGLELGQLAIVLSAWFILKKISQNDINLNKKMKFAGSFIIILFATKWFIERVFI